MTYIDLTGLSDDEKNAIYRKHAAEGVTYHLADGQVMHSSEVVANIPPPTTKRIPVPEGFFPMEFKRQPVEKKRGRPTTVPGRHQLKLIQQAWPDPWLQDKIRQEMGLESLDEATFKDFEHCLRQVGNEKGWVIEW